MHSRTVVVSVALIAILVTAETMSAHHGAAAYEAPLTTLTAIVSGFDWKNPHALIHFSVTHGTSSTTAWTAETAGLVILVRAGWNRDAVKVGDRVTVVGRRAINGSPALLLQRLVFSDGRTLNSFLPPS